jgi:putative flippase GtrA
MDAMVAKLISVLVVAIIQYFVNKKLTFRKKKLVTINDESELN